MNPLSIIASAFIAAGAVVMTMSILKFRAVIRMLKEFAVEGYGKLKLLFSFHEILMGFFLFGYLVVLYAIITKIQLVGDLFVGAIFFFGAIFVLLGIVLQSRMLAAISKGYDELAGYRKHLERLVNIRTHELTNAKEEIKKRERYLESVLHNAPDAIVTLDSHHCVIEWNPGAEQIFGYSSEEVAGRDLDDLIATRVVLDEAKTFTKTVLSGEKLLPREAIRYRKDGTTVPVMLAASPIQIGEESQGGVAIYTDITALKQAEEELKGAKESAEAANRAKSTFLANMSHELRTPLNAIIGYSEMLAEDAEDSGQKDFIPDLEKIQEAGKHLLVLINEVLDLSKIEAGKMELYLETFDVSNMVEQVISTIQPLAEKNANPLEVHYSEDLGTMHADLTKVRQVLFNLLSNACKFTDHGTISLDIAREKAGGVDWIAFSVKDTGIGMTAEHMERLFQAFSQADALTGRKYGGTGLGLAISKRFCNMMGGDITVESQHGKGSTFTVRLPANVAKSEPDTFPAEGSAVMPVLEEASTVLVIDDDPTVRDLMKRYLSKEGYRVETASGGEEGLQLAGELHPDAITLDVLMPGMDGWAVLKALKADPQLADIPVIMLTIMDEDNMGYTLGASDYLTKPISKDRLVAVLQRYQRYPARVLVVEDDPAAREIVRRMLVKEGWTVLEAENGRAALERIAESKPAFILLDLMMPEMDGFEFIDELRTHKNWRSIPVAVITAKDLTSEERERLRGRVERILEKGVYSREELLAKVRDLVATSVRKKTPVRA